MVVLRSVARLMAPVLLLILAITGITANRNGNQSAPMMMHIEGMEAPARSVVLHDLERGLDVPIRIGDSLYASPATSLDAGRLIYAPHQGRDAVQCTLVHLTGTRAGEFVPLSPAAETCIYELDRSETHVASAVPQRDPVLGDVTGWLVRLQTLDGTQIAEWDVPAPVIHIEGHASISTGPDARHILLFISTPDAPGRRHLMLIDTEADTVTQITDAPLAMGDFPAMPPFWSGNGRYYMMWYDPRPDSALFQRRLLAVDTETGTLVQPLDGTVDLTALNQSPDYRYYSFDRVTYSPETYHPHLFDTQTGRLIPVFDEPLPEKQRVSNVYWSPDLRYMALHIRPLFGESLPYTAQFYDLETGQFLQTFESLESTLPLVWSEDGQTVFVTTSFGSAVDALHRYDLASGRVDTYDGAAAYHPSTAPSARWAVAAHGGETASALELHDMNTGETTMIPLPEALRREPVWLPSGEHILHKTETAFYLYGIADAVLTRLDFEEITPTATQPFDGAFVFQDQRHDVYRLDLHSYALERLVADAPGATFLP